MSFFCKLFGHTWVPVTVAPQRRWHTTKDMHTLHQEEIVQSAIRHFDRCARCGTERDAGSRRLDADRVDVESVGGKKADAEPETE
jgi:hypothetical protein